MKIKRVFLVVLLVAGCTSSSVEKVNTVISEYETVKFDDGVDVEEAVIIAKRELIKQNMADLYDLDEPKVVKDVADLPNYGNYWFISFKEIKVKNIEYVFMAIVDKSNGKVKFADDYKEDRRWILEAALLK